MALPEAVTRSKPAKAVQDHEGARPRPKKAVVGPQHKADSSGEELHLPGGELLHPAVQAEVPVEQKEQGDHREQADEDVVQRPLAEQKVQPRPQGGADEGGDGGDRRRLPVEPALLQKPQGGYGSAKNRAALIGGGGHVGRKAGHQIGRQGNEPAAPRHRVHQSRQKHQGTDDEEHAQCNFHRKSSKLGKLCFVS